MARDPNPTHKPVDPLPGVAPWIGGKRNLAARLVARIERVPHRCYAEPFGGMGGVFLRRRRRPPVEAFNDRHGEVVNLFRIVQRHPRALAAELRHGLAARATFDRLKRSDPATLTDVERAARFYFLLKAGWGGMGGSFGIDTIQGARFDAGDVPRLVRRLWRRLRGVYIEQLDFAAFIARYDRPGTLFYCDPPYWGSERDYGRDLFSRDDFARLAQALRAIKGSFILSLNDRPEIRALFDGCRIERVETTYHVGGARRVRELVISR